MKKLFAPGAFWCFSLVFLSSSVFAMQEGVQVQPVEDAEMMYYTNSSSCPSDQMDMMLERFDDVLTKKADRLDAIAGEDPNHH